MPEDNKPVVNCFNKVFSTMGSKSAEQFQSNQSDTVLPQSDYQLLKFSEIAVQFVNNQLQHLDSYKATGEENIKYRLLKDAAHIVSEA